MMPNVRAALLLCSIVACAGGLPTPTTTAPDVLAASDSLRPLVGEWIVEFRVDSVWAPGNPATRWRPGSMASTQGQLRLSDSTVGQANVVRSSIQVSFDSVLGRPMSCFDPRPTTTGIYREGDEVTLRFTPNGADCGFSAYATLRGDSLVGTWDESGFAGPSVMGRFRMVRSGR